MNPPASDEKVPLTFKILVGAAAAYLAVRFVQGVAWVADRLQ